MADRGRDVSMALTEVRTVLSRAENALDHASYFASDPDSAEMLEALGAVVSVLRRWRKTGAPRKRECSACGREKVTIACAETGEIDGHMAVLGGKYQACPGGR